MENEQSLQKVMKLLFFLSVVKRGMMGGDSFEISEGYRAKVSPAVVVFDGSFVDINHSHLSDDA